MPFVYAPFSARVRPLRPSSRNRCGSWAWAHRRVRPWRAQASC